MSLEQDDPSALAHECISYGVLYCVLRNENCHAPKAQGRTRPSICNPELHAARKLHQGEKYTFRTMLSLMTCIALTHSGKHKTYLAPFTFMYHTGLQGIGAELDSTLSTDHYAIKERSFTAHT